jgi:hypothetical protein
VVLPIEGRHPPKRTIAAVQRASISRSPINARQHRETCICGISKTRLRGLRARIGSIKSRLPASCRKREGAGWVHLVFASIYLLSLGSHVTGRFTPAASACDAYPTAAICGPPLGRQRDEWRVPLEPHKALDDGLLSSPLTSLLGVPTLFGLILAVAWASLELFRLAPAESRMADFGWTWQSSKF